MPSWCLKDVIWVLPIPTLWNSKIELSNQKMIMQFPKFCCNFFGFNFEVKIHFCKFGHKKLQTRKMFSWTPVSQLRLKCFALPLKCTKQYKTNIFLSRLTFLFNYHIVTSIRKIHFNDLIARLLWKGINLIYLCIWLILFHICKVNNVIK